MKKCLVLKDKIEELNTEGTFVSPFNKCTE